MAFCFQIAILLVEVYGMAIGNAACRPRFIKPGCRTLMGTGVLEVADLLRIILEWSERSRLVSESMFSLRIGIM
jgi:hypothetical protein